MYEIKNERVKNKNYDLGISKYVNLRKLKYCKCAWYQNLEISNSFEL